MPPETTDESLMNQYKCPTGLQGKEVAAMMNRRHLALTTWGLKHVRIEPDFVILDVGCGGGKTISRLARRAFQGKVYGIDCSADMVNYSSEFNRKLIAENRVKVVHGSVEKMLFKDQFFDLVTAIETYYFWPDITEAFREMMRVLKVGGHLLIISEMIKDGMYEEENAETIAKTSVRLLPLQEIQSALQSVGFVNVIIFTKSKLHWSSILAKKE